MPLSEEAKAELADAIRIVREDKFEAYARGILDRKPETPKADELLDQTPSTVKDDKTVDSPPKQQDDTSPKEESRRRDAYWGELLD